MCNTIPSFTLLTRSTVVSKTGYTNPGATKQRFTFNSISARYVKVVGINLYLFGGQWPGIICSLQKFVYFSGYFLHGRVAICYLFMYTPANRDNLRYILYLVNKILLNKFEDV